MNAAVVCISRTVAAGGSHVGQLVAERLGYHYYDEEVIDLAAKSARLDPHQLAAVEEHEGLLSRIIDALAAVSERPRAHPPASKGAEAAAGASGRPPAREESRQLIRAVITQIGKLGNAVIVAHAASIPLAGMRGVLRVLITAPVAVRAQRLELVGIVGEREALSTIQESDRARLSYLRDFYAVSEETPTLYDLVINTEVLSHETAASIIVSAARGGASA